MTRTDAQLTADWCWHYAMFCAPDMASRAMWLARAAKAARAGK